MSRALRALRLVLTSYLFLLAVGAVLGYLVFVSTIGRPKVGIIDVPYTVLVTETVADISAKIQYARARPDIKAVVIKVDSPGGSVAPSEEFFLQLFELQKEKPVVFLAGDVVASGGYLAAMGANYIYAKPTSFVGNIGAIIYAPKCCPPFEDLFSTGPYKLYGGSQRSYVELLESVKEAFAETVVSQRGKQLRITKEQLLSGRLFIGMDAVRFGVVDAIGSETDAVRKAASLAKIRNYDLVDVNQEVRKLSGPTLYYYGAQSAQSANAPKSPKELLERREFPYVYYLFVEPR